MTKYVVNYFLILVYLLKSGKTTTPKVNLLLVPNGEDTFDNVKDNSYNRIVDGLDDINYKLNSIIDHTDNGDELENINSAIEVNDLIDEKINEKKDKKHELIDEGSEIGMEEEESEDGRKKLLNNMEMQEKAHNLQLKLQHRLDNKLNKAENYTEEQIENDENKEREFEKNLEDDIIEAYNDDKENHLALRKAKEKELDAINKINDELYKAKILELNSDNRIDSKLREASITEELEEDDCPEGYIHISKLKTDQANEYKQNQNYSQYNINTSNKALPCPVAVGEGPCPCVMEYFEPNEELDQSNQTSEQENNNEIDIDTKENDGHTNNLNEDNTEQEKKTKSVPEHHDSINNQQEDKQQEEKEEEEEEEEENETQKENHSELSPKQETHEDCETFLDKLTAEFPNNYENLTPEELQRRSQSLGPKYKARMQHVLE